MITRIHGASSTLAANPPRKHRRAKAARRRNPARAHKRRRNPENEPSKKRAYAKKGRTLAERLEFYRGQAAALEKRASDKAAKAAAPKQSRKGPRTEKGRLKAARKQQRADYGYTLAPLGKGEQFLSYAYAKKGKPDKAGRRRTLGYIGSTKLMKGLKPKFTIYKTSGGKFGLRKNPAIGNLVVAGVPVINMAIGSVAAIAIGMISQKVIAKYAPSVASSPVGDITGELATAGIAAYLHSSKLLKNDMHKSIAQFAFIGAVFQILSKKATAYVGPLVDKIPGLSGYEGYTGGVYFDPYTQSPAVGGTYLPTGDMGGIYASVDHGTEMGGLNLFKAPSFYG